MNFNPTIGKIYDTIFFLTEYFNGNRIAYSVDPYYDIGEMLTYHKRIKDVISVVPPILKPFLYSKPESLSVLTKFFFLNPYENFTDIQDFIAFIKMKSDDLRDSLVVFIDSMDDASQQELAMDITQVAKCFGKWDNTIDELCKCLNSVYIEVERLHFDNQTKITKLLDNCQSYDIKRMLADILRVSDEQITSAQITISLLNQYLFHAKTINFVHLLVLGIYSELDIVSGCDNQYSSVDNFIITFSGELRVKVLHALIDKGELTASQIAKYIDCPPTTLIRPISIMLASKLIYVSRRSGLNIYYRLNTELLKRTYKNFDSMFKNILDLEVYNEIRKKN